MDDKFVEWRESLDVDDVVAIIVNRVGDDSIEELLWEQFIEDEQDRVEWIGEQQMENEREDQYGEL